METFTLFWLSFLAGIYASVGAPCAFVMYPGYISFLAGKTGDEGHRPEPFTLGILVAIGVIVAMLTGGLLFSFAGAEGGGAVRNLIAPAAFILLFFFSLMVIFDINFGKIPVANPIPMLKNPLTAAFFLGLTFGIIILPCNAAAVVVLLALAATATGLFEGLGAFLSFGLGITLPLLVLAGFSQAAGRQVMEYLTRHRRAIRMIGGIMMLILSVWYLALLFLPQSFSFLIQMIP
jgi:cytochrome c-type biogenesis protein